eukprot:5448495-Pleurochrysis_carterae.AAC.1
MSLFLVRYFASQLEFFALNASAKPSCNQLPRAKAGQCSSEHNRTTQHENAGGGEYDSVILCDETVLGHLSVAESAPRDVTAHSSQSLSLCSFDHSNGLVVAGHAEAMQQPCINDVVC